MTSAPVYFIFSFPSPSTFSLSSTLNSTSPSAYTSSFAPASALISASSFMFPLLTYPFNFLIPFFECKTKHITNLNYFEYKNCF